MKAIGTTVFGTGMVQKWVIKLWVQTIAFYQVHEGVSKRQEEFDSIQTILR
jgi:hypothetical protein